MKLTKTNAMLWEMECNGQDDLNKAGIELCAASHVGSGNPVVIDGTTLYLHIVFNGLDIEFQSARDLWFFGHGLVVAASTLPISFVSETIKRMVN